MPWERPSIKTIAKRIDKSIESRLFGNIALLRNAVLRILSRAFAGAIHTNYGHVEYIKDAILFVTTANEDALKNRHAPMWGIKPRPGSFATGRVRFVGVNGAVINQDTRLQSEDGIEYGTLSPVTITDGIAEGDIQAVEAGLEGNISIPAGDNLFLQLIKPIKGVDGEVQVIQDITGGQDSEDVEEIRSRILQRIQYPPMGGAVHDYERWAMEVPGVKMAWVYPLAYGPGTVVTVIIAEGENPVPSSVLVSDVQAYISEVKPVTANHTVQAITDTSGNPGTAKISMDIALSPDDVQYREKIKSNLDVLLETHKPGTDIKISQIRGAISASGVEDYRVDTIRVDGSSRSISDVELSGFQYPTIESLSFYGV